MSLTLSQAMHRAKAMARLTGAAVIIEPLDPQGRRYRVRFATP